MKPSETSNQELHNHIEEVVDLQTTFLAMLADAMHDGVNHSYRGKWRHQDFDTHIDHAIMHLLALKYPREGDLENHLEHACFRVVAAGTVQEGDYSDEENSFGVDRWESEGGSAMGGSEAMGKQAEPYKFEFGQVVGHHSGLDIKRPSGALQQLAPAPDTYPAAANQGFEWCCNRCGESHPFTANCKV